MWGRGVAHSYTFAKRLVPAARHLPEFWHPNFDILGRDYLSL